MRKAFLRTASDSSLTSSDSSGSELLSENGETPERRIICAERIAQLYSTARVSIRLDKAAKASGISMRAEERILSSILSARAAVLRNQWSFFLEAFKKLEAAVKPVGTNSKLGYKLPILGETPLLPLPSSGLYSLYNQLVWFQMPLLL